MGRQVTCILFCIILIMLVTGCGTAAPVAGQPDPSDVLAEPTTAPTPVQQTPTPTPVDPLQFAVLREAGGQDMNQSNLVPGRFAVDDFVLGGIRVSNGSGDNTVNENRLRSGFWPLGSITVTWDPASGLQYLVGYFDSDFRFLWGTEFSAVSRTVSAGDVSGASYAVFILGYADGTAFDAEHFRLPEGCSIVSDLKLNTFHDLPNSQGVRNAIDRAMQSVELSIVTRAVLPGQKGDVAPDTRVDGVMYSSTRQESLYVPNAVSFESYLSAASNPKSYLYTRVSELRNSRTYYGSVCSSFISYNYDLPCIYTTHQLGLLDGLVYLEDQSIDNIRLGDMILKRDSHVCMIVGVERTPDGRIINLVEAEARAPQVRVRTYSRREFNDNWLNAGYDIYRYTKINDVPPADTSWEKHFHLNENLCPRRGDKANWPLGETVEIDVLNAASYERAVLTRGSEVVSVSAIPEDFCLRYEDLSSGSYQVYLTGPEGQSRPASFLVVDTRIGAEVLEDGNVKLTFSSSNAKPSWYAWCYPDTNHAGGVLSKTSRDYMAVSRAYALTAEEQANGFVLTNHDPGTWLLKVEFETDYGQISSDFVQVSVP